MYLILILISAFIMSILLSLAAFNASRPSMEIVNDMGLGWNLANTFESFNIHQEIKNPEDQITLWGNQFPKKEIFTRLKKYGFKTIRFPVTWFHFMESSGKVKQEWMEKVKEVVDMIIESNMYCILNIHNDGQEGNWLSKGLKAKEIYIVLWQQIADEFKIYDDNLIFESMNDVIYKNGDDYDYKTLLKLTQSFVDIIRSSGGNNENRLLLISGADTNLELICSEDYKMPIDPSNKLAVSIHYYIPPQFTVEKDDDPFFWIDENGEKRFIPPLTKWGSEGQYKDMFTNFETMKKSFVDKGIPVVLGEVGVLTEQKKEIESIREFLFAQFSMSGSYDGIMSCLWDNSNGGDMNYYNREKDKWYDEIIKDNFKKISKGKFVKPKDYFFVSDKDSVYTLEPDGTIYMQFGAKKLKKIIFNAFISTNLLYNTGFGISSNNKNGAWVGEAVAGNSGKRQYDGSHTFTIDVNTQDYNDYIKIEKWWGNEFITINYLTLQFDRTYNFFNFKEYKKNFAN